MTVVCFCIDDDYLVPFLVSYKSLLTNYSGPKLRVYVFTDCTESVLKSLLLVIENNDIVESIVTPLSREAFTFPENSKVSGYFRLLLPEILPNEEKILYLDADTLVLDNIADLYNEDITMYGFGACVHFTYPIVCMNARFNETALAEEKPEAFQLNSGVLLLNLNTLRAQHFTQNTLDFLLKKRVSLSMHLPFGDQDALNILYLNSWKVLPSEWNFHPIFSKFWSGKGVTNIIPGYSLYEKIPKIVHFAGDSNNIKPWNLDCEQTAYTNKWWEILLTFENNPLLWPVIVRTLEDSFIAKTKRQFIRAFAKLPSSKESILNSLLD